MMNEDIGSAAGKVWKVLSSNGPMATNDLKKETDLDNERLNMALGWLAREDKVNLERVGKKKLQVALR